MKRLREARDELVGLHRRLGRPGSINWSLFGISYVLGLLAYAAANGVDTWFGLLIGLAAASAGHLVMFAVLGIGALLFLRGPERRPWVMHVLVFLGAGLRGLVIAYAKVALGITDHLDLWLRVSSSLMVMGVVVSSLAVAEDALREHSRSRRELLDVRERLQHVREEIPQVIAKRQAEFLAGVRATLTAELSSLAAEGPSEAVFRLRRAAYEIVRPISHELATDSAPYTPTQPNRRPPGLDWRETLRDATADRPHRPLVWAVLSVGPSSTYVIDGAGLAGGLRLIAVDMAVAYVLAWLGNVVVPLFVRRGGLAWRTYVFSATYLATGAVTFFLNSTVLEALLPFDRSGFVLAFAPTLGWVIAIVSAASRVKAKTEAELAELASQLDWEVARANERQVRLQRTVARQLHGPVQAALNAAALRLDAAVRSGEASPEFLAQTKDWLVETLRELEGQTFADSICPREAFARISGTWEGVCEITFNLDEDVRNAIYDDQDATSAAVDIVTEACSNAIRHGGATRISVRLWPEWSPGRLRVVIEDDSPREFGRGEAGLGTKILEQTCLSWDREQLQQGQRLSVVLPLLVKLTEPALVS